MTARSRFRRAVRRNWPIELLGALALLLPLLSLALAWSGLPDAVPVNFDAAGQPSRFDSKAVLWLLPGVSAAVWLLFSLMQAAPVDSLNLPVKVTAGNRDRLERVSSRALAGVKAIIAITLALIAQAMLEAAQGSNVALSPGVILLATLGPVPVLVWLVVASRKERG